MKQFISAMGYEVSAVGYVRRCGPYIGRGIAISLAILLALGNFPLALAAEPPKPAEYDTGEAAGAPPAIVKSTAPPTPAPGAMGTREPLIEVSVDSLEINETNNSVLGLIWGDQNGNAGQVIFQERSIPSIFQIGTLDRITQLQAILKALITNNQARVLANPTLLTKSGFEATFLVGGEIPYPQVGQGGVTGTEFKKYGVGLKILPQITPRKTIDAQINVSVSNIDNANSKVIANVQVPALTTRETGTKVEVNDGETVVLSGIKQSRRDKTVTRTPFLSAIPLIGLLFRSTTEETVQTSLVIFVTFRYIK